MRDVTGLLKKLNYEFKDENLLEVALTHSSYINENKLNKNLSNERLEFLGDAVLGLVIAEYFFKNEKKSREGKLSKLRSEVVNERSLAIIAFEISLGKYINFGKGEFKNGGAKNESILADAMEAVIGAIYLDSNYKTVKNIILDIFSELIVNVEKKKNINDSKSRFQEIVQSEGNSHIKYILEKTEGPDNRKIFHSAVYVDDTFYGRGKGTTKKRSEQKAAESALVKIEGKNV